MLPGIEHYVSKVVDIITINADVITGCIVAVGKNGTMATAVGSAIAIS